MLSSFKLRDFRLLWLASLGFAGGMWVQQVAVGWLVLEMTGSPLALGLVQAARTLPSLFFGMAAGVLADRFDRRTLLLIIGLVSAAYSLLLASLIPAGALELWHVVLLTLVFGACRAFEWPAAQALVYDLVGAEEALKGIALNATANRVMGVASGFLGGAVIPTFGPGGSLLLMGAGYLAGSLLLLLVHPPRRGRTAKGEVSFWGSLRAGYGLARNNQRVRALLGLSVVAEIFAFSHQSLLPIYARDILQSGPVGLGALVSARALGSVASALLLARLAYYPEKVRLLLGAFGLYGASLAGFAASEVLVLSFLLMTGVGLAASSFDLLQSTILQLSVAEEDRGRAMGYWVASLGFGPVGHLEIGALAAWLGAPSALGVHSALLLVVFGLVVARGLIKPRGVPPP